MTDDELILFDAIAIHPGVPRFFLGKEDYPLHLNCEYTHSLSDDELENRLREMERRGWLKSYSDPDFTPWPDLSGPELENWPRLSRRHDLTPTGMELWEAERNPVWERYAFDLGSFWEEGADNFFEVHCVNPEIGRECALVSRECGLVDFDLDTLVYLPESGFESPKGQSMHLWRAIQKEQKEDSSPERDRKMWALYDEKRTWWRTLDELQKFSKQD